MQLKSKFSSTYFIFIQVILFSIPLNVSAQYAAWEDWVRIYDVDHGSYVAQDFGPALPSDNFSQILIKADVIGLVSITLHWQKADR